MDRSQLEKTLGGPVQFGPLRQGTTRWGKREKHLWCRSCLRTYPNGIHREVDGVRRCPYADCAATAIPNDWSFVLAAHPEYPSSPWMSVRYPFDVNMKSPPWHST